MRKTFTENDYKWIRELMEYPRTTSERLGEIEDTSHVLVPEDPIDRVIFQDKAKAAIRKIAQNRGHILMVGRPGTGKSLLANMFNLVLSRAVGEYLKPKNTILSYPGKDKNHIRFAYEKPEKVDQLLNDISEGLNAARNQVEPFELTSQIQSVRKVKMWLLLVTAVSLVGGVFFPPAFVLTGLAGIGAIFMFIQENNHKAQEKIQQETQKGTRNPTKHIEDLIPEVLYDPRKDKELMARISEPSHRNMKGGFRHDPYQSGNLHTPAHKRAFLGAHAKSPIIYIDELKTLVSSGYMPDLLEIMQNNEYTLEGGNQSGSGAADRAENALRANNIIIASCNHDTLAYLQKEGDGAFLSRIEDKGEIIQMESAVPETSEALSQVVQYIKQEINNLGEKLEESWGEVVEKEGREGLRKRSEQIFGTSLPADYDLTPREFARGAVLEVIKELRCRASDRKLSGILRPINGIILTAEFAAINDGSKRVEAEHVRHALREHVSLEGALAREIQEQKNHLKRYITAMTDSIGYVVGLAVIQSRSSGAMHGQPLPIHGQIDVGGTDTVTSPGKIGDIAKAAAQNVRASIKKVFRKIGAPPVGYEMHVEYVQAHSGVEGDSASVAMDVALISDYIQQPVSQRFGVTGSLTGDIILAVGGVTEKVKSIMEPSLKMQGACIPWQNKYDVEPLLLNTKFEYIQREEIPGIRIFRGPEKENPFDVFFCKTKYNVYKILMGLDREAIEEKMIARSRQDLAFIRQSSSRHSEEALEDAFVPACAMHPADEPVKACSSGSGCHDCVSDR